MRLIDADALINNLQGSTVKTEITIKDTEDIKTVWDLLCTLVVEAIQSEPTVEPGGDYISRADAIAVHKPDYSYEADMVRRLKESLSADAVQGEWKCMGDCGVTECDQCGWSIEEYVGDYNYCPNCGARMKGGAE